MKRNMWNRNRRRRGASSVHQTDGGEEEEEENEEVKLLYRLTSSPSVYLYYYLPAVRHSVTCRLHIGLFLIKQITDFTY